MKYLHTVPETLVVQRIEGWDDEKFQAGLRNLCWSVPVWKTVPAVFQTAQSAWCVLWGAYIYVSKKKTAVLLSSKLIVLLSVVMQK